METVLAAFCSKSGMRKAAATLNLAFQDEPMPTPVKLELGVMLLLTALHFEVDEADRQVVLAQVVGRLVQVPPPVLDPSVALELAPAAQTRTGRRRAVRLH